jgi:hypothetical protein
MAALGLAETEEAKDCNALDIVERVWGSGDPRGGQALSRKVGGPARHRMARAEDRRSRTRDWLAAAIKIRLRLGLPKHRLTFVSGRNPKVASMMGLDLYKSPADRKVNTRHRGGLRESRRPGEPLVPASVMRLMRAFAGACIVVLVCGPGALALTCDELKAADL